MEKYASVHIFLEIRMFLRNNEGRRHAMLKRKATDFLNNWKSGKRKSLIITGARQVGKTFTVRMFAKEKYETFYELNWYLFSTKAVL
jgi:predicted AAA+ superfamily ATPase